MNSPVDLIFVVFGLFALSAPFVIVYGVISGWRHRTGRRKPTRRSSVVFPTVDAQAPTVDADGRLAVLPSFAKPPLPQMSTQTSRVAPSPSVPSQRAAPRVRSNDDVASALRELRDLHAEGLLTETEYEQKRQALADQL